jgi:hypothetical protein
MSNYTPNRWVVVDITVDGESIKKVFAGWYGGYLDGDSWKLNSGIVKEEEFETSWEFTGYSGSVYICYKSAYGLSSYMSSVLSGWTDIINEGESITIQDQYEPKEQ